MMCNICGIEIEEGCSLCEGCAFTLDNLFERYDSKSLGTLFVYLLGGKLVEELHAGMVSEIKSEYSKELLKNMKEENPQ